MLYRNIHEEISVIKEIQAQCDYIDNIFRRIYECVSCGGKLIWMGNGGSAVDSMHFSSELVGQYKRKRNAIASIALSANVASITAIANDINYETIFSRQLEALANKKDVVIALTTSGKSTNIYNALKWCKDRSIYTVLITGEAAPNMTLDKATEVIKIRSQSTPRIQEAYYLICHTLCEYLEEKVGG